MKQITMIRLSTLVWASCIWPAMACTLELKDAIQANEQRVVTAAQTQGLSTETSVEHILKTLGPATSGTTVDSTYFLHWQLVDGREFFVFSDGLCVKPSYAGITGYTTTFLSTPTGQLLVAIEEGHLDTVKSILSTHPEIINGADENSHYSLLAKAITTIERNDDVIDYLLKHGADAKFTTSEGYNLLHLNIDVNGALENGSEYKVAKLLVAHGADIEAKNHYGWTPLMRAGLEGSDKDFEALLRLGANFKVPFSQSSMPEFTRGQSMMQVVLSEPTKIKLLLQHGYRPTASDIHNAEKTIEASHEEKGTDYYQRLTKSLNLLKQAQKNKP